MLTDDLQQSFSNRLINGLVDDGVLRGSWAEELVAHFLQAEPQRQWSYFDLKWRAYKVSVKHSVGNRARFDVEAKKSAWDYAQLASTGDGWREEKVATYWCDLYVFAHLAGDDSASPRLADILDPSAWTFAVCSKADMVTWFTGQKTASLNSLGAHVSFVPGEQLEAAAIACTA